MIGRYHPARRAIWSALRRRPRALLALLAWSSVEALPALLSGHLTARAVDQGFLAGRVEVGLGWLVALGVAVLVAGVGTDRTYRALAGLVEPFRDELLAGVAAGALRRAVAAGGRPDASPVARLTHQVEIVRDTFGGMVMVVRGFTFAAAGALIGLFSLAPVLAALVAAPLLLGLGLFLATLPATVTRQRDYVLAAEGLAEQAGQAVAGARDVVACGAEERVAAALDVHIDSQARSERRLAGMAAARSLCLAVGGWLPLVLLLAVAPWLVGRGMTAGAVLGALVYVTQALQPALHTLVRGLGGGGVRLLVTLDRLLTADEPAAAPPPRRGRRPAPTPQHAPPPRWTAPPAPADSGLSLRGVTFRYGPHAEPVLDHLDLVVAPGEHLAIVGPSGIGKSTLVNLLAGTLRPQQGEVRLGGVPLDRLDRRALTRYRVLIPQEAYVFSGTLEENLTYLCHDHVPDLDALDRAVDAMGLRPVVDRLGGYTARVEPESLSAGERQLVALARAYLTSAQVVLLDEATCHLDPATEERVELAFAARPWTLVVIAHRISSAERADRVLVLDGTDAVVDRPDVVAERSALYRDLAGQWSGQAHPPGLRWPPDGGSTVGPRPAVPPGGAPGGAVPEGGRSHPSGLLGDAQRLDPRTPSGLRDDPGQVVAYRARRER